MTFKQRETLEAAAALDKILAARPLAPPPLPQENPTRSAAWHALQQEIRDGWYTP